MQSYIAHGKRQAKVSLPAEHYQQAAHWLPVCPVHLIADRDTLVLTPPETLDLTESETEVFIESFNRHFKQDGYLLYAQGTQTWWLGANHSWQLGLPSLSEAIAMNLRDAWEEGKDARQWRKLLNEAQMLWYLLPQNVQREQQGRHTVNGLWPLLPAKTWWQRWFFR